MAFVARSRKSGVFRRGGVQVRETLWIGDSIGDNVLAAGGTAVLLAMLNATALALRPFTVVRSRGLLAIRSDQQAANEAFQCAFGAAIVSAQAEAIGVTAIPTPITDNASDLWYIYETMFGNFQFASGVGFDSAPNNREVDSKAMRKVEDGEQLIFAVESDASSSGLVFTSFVRTLVKLH